LDCFFLDLRVKVNIYGQVSYSNTVHIAGNYTTPITLP